MKVERIEELYKDELKSAEAAGLIYIQDLLPGITRQKKGRGFAYFDAKDEPVSEQKKDWIEGLAIPPAWKDVWISPKRNAHLLVTGHDDKDRKQYIYHPRWRQVRDLLNFYRLILFGESLPTIRRHLATDLSERGLSHDKVVAVIVDILDRTYIRIGNEEYAVENEHYGLTTFRNEHVKVRGSHLVFSFVGKSGKEHEVEVDDAQLAKIIKACQDVPEEHLFSYLDDDGTALTVTSTAVNEYLQEVVKDFQFTAKNFRTWGGTLTTYEYLLQESKKNPEKKAKTVIAEAIEETADKLGNTKAVSKAHYIHPHLVKAYEEGTFENYLQRLPELSSRRGITMREQELIEMLRLLFVDEWKKALEADV